MILPETNREYLTALVLTETLRANGHLTRGQVMEVSTVSFQSFFANFYRIELTYSTDAWPKLPRHMILKVPFSNNESSLSMGGEEVLAYIKLHALMPDPPIVRCFDHLVVPDTSRSHLLLEDLSFTHFRSDAEHPATLRQWELCVEALAQVHAFWWESEALGVELGHIITSADIEELKSLHEASLVEFFAVMGEAISRRLRQVYQAALLFLPSFWQSRLTSRARNTLIHGDAHSWNFLLPKDVTNGRACMIDLATMRVRPATNDLAYLMALKWRPDNRARMEIHLLRHYHRSLTARGVKGYSWDDCLLDYRHSVVAHLFTPVVQCAGRSLSAGIWRANFERITAAFEDLNCGGLI